jgi:hypothetical protein
MWYDEIAQVMTINVLEKEVDLVAMTDGLIEIAAAIGELSCRNKSVAEPTVLLFATDEDEFSIVTQSPLLRAICARLAVVASGGNALKLNPYGDTAEFSWRAGSDNPVRIRLHFENHKERWFRLSRA